MNLISRTLSGLFVLTAVLLTCTSLSADWLFELGVLTSLFETQRKDEQLTRETQSTVERLTIKERIAEALRNGEMVLIDAAAYFRSLHEDPKSWHHPRRPRPGLKDGEGWCREVIDWTVHNTCIDHSPSQADALRQRLEAELQEQLECHGAVTLPD